MQNETQIFPPKEVAMELKKVGFNELCVAVYFGYDKNESTTPYPSHIYMKNANMGKTSCTAPAYDQVIGWFAEVHGIEIDPCADSNMTEYSTDVWQKGQRVYEGAWLESRQQSLLTAFREAIKLIE